MKKTSHWGKPVALLALLLSAVSGLKATATVVNSATLANTIRQSEVILSQTGDNFELARRLVAKCRAANRSMFIYQDRSTTNPIRALQIKERVTLAEQSSRDGWIAVSSPVSGFVWSRNLTSCSDVVEEESFKPTEEYEENLPRGLCRRVRYELPEGLVIRKKPNSYSPRIGGVFPGEWVALSSSPQFSLDSEGREWVELQSPQMGWVSNGFPKLGDINLEACY
ncbi:SH3 domain-containing protein [Lyngbya aestuarii]|uniref:SH3 domain-containing protein n=1 Tax=Lyngbya aestuarii TaxID=118322 RepID=UPI00403DF680